MSVSLVGLCVSVCVCFCVCVSVSVTVSVFMSVSVSVYTGVQSDEECFDADSMRQAQILKKYYLLSLYIVHILWP